MSSTGILDNNGVLLVLISYDLAMSYAVDVQPTLKEHTTINANRIKNAVRSLVDSVKSAVKAPAVSYSYAIAA